MTRSLLRLTLLALTCLVSASATARADILLPGEVPARHTLRFVNVASHPGFAFFVASPAAWHGFGAAGPIRVPASGEVSLSALNKAIAGHGLFLYAVPTTGLALPAAHDGLLALLEDPARGVLRSNRLVDPVFSVSGATEEPEFVTECSIAIGDALVVAQVGGSSEPRTRVWILLLPGVSLVAIGVWLASRRRKRDRGS